MRVIAGTFRGRKLNTFEGRDIRPTTDRMRETIFSSAEHRIGGFHDKTIADIFSGTGAFGLEALSRGAEHATFIEKDRKALKLLEDNIALLGVGAKSKIIPTDVLVLKKPETPFDLILMDPPYGKGLIGPTLKILKEGGWLKKEGLLMVEADQKEIFEIPKGWAMIKTLSQGFRAAHFIQNE